MSRSFVATALLGALSLTLVTVPGASAHTPDVRPLGVTTVPNALPFEGTTVGGLSGIDRDPRTGRYVLVSDDRSQRQPAHFYTAEIDVSADGLGEEGSARSS